MLVCVLGRQAVAPSRKYNLGPDRWVLALAVRVKSLTEHGGGKILHWENFVSLEKLATG